MDNLEILKLTSQGYCCSQVMVILSLSLMDAENPELVSFSRGLCMGHGSETGDCGILTAGICIIAMMASQDPDLRATLQEQFSDDFKAMAAGETTCRGIAGTYYPRMHPTACGDLLSKAHAHLLTLLAESGIDPADPWA